MALTYTFKIDSVRVTTQDDLTDVVRELNLTITGEDGNAKFEYPMQMNIDQADSENFTPFSELTEEQMISWVEQSSEIVSAKEHIALVVEKEAVRLSLEPKPLPWG